MSCVELGGVISPKIMKLIDRYMSLIAMLPRERVRSNY